MTDQPRREPFSDLIQTRIEPSLRRSLQERAADAGEPAAAVLRRALRPYLRDESTPREPRQQMQVGAR
jgi:hypothetical protein